MYWKLDGLSFMVSFKRTKCEIDFVEAPHAQHNSNKFGTAFA